MQKFSSGLFKNVIYKMCSEIVYLFKKNLTFNDLLWSICHRNQTKTYLVLPGPTLLNYSETKYFNSPMPLHKFAQIQNKTIPF